MNKIPRQDRTEVIFNPDMQGTHFIAGRQGDIYSLDFINPISDPGNLGMAFV